MHMLFFTEILTFLRKSTKRAYFGVGDAVTPSTHTLSTNHMAVSFLTSTVQILTSVTLEVLKPEFLVQNHLNLDFLKF